MEIADPYFLDAGGELPLRETRAPRDRPVAHIDQGRDSGRRERRNHPASLEVTVGLEVRYDDLLAARRGGPASAALSGSAEELSAGLRPMQRSASAMPS